MKTSYLILAAVAVLSSSASLIKAEKEPEVIYVEHEHWPHRGRLRQAIHESRMEHREEKYGHVEEEPRRGKVVRERRYERPRRTRVLGRCRHWDYECKRAKYRDEPRREDRD